MQTITNIIFDIGGVIVLQKKIDLSIFDRELRFPPNTVLSIVQSCFEKKTMSKDFDEEAYFKKHFLHILTWAKYQEVLKHIFATERLNDPLVDWIQNHKNKYRFFALTNNTMALKRLIEEKFRIPHLFNRVFNSAEIGFTKPDPRIFNYMLREIDAVPEDCLFIDDNEKNTAAAQGLGFKTITFKNNQQLFETIGNHAL